MMFQKKKLNDHCITNRRMYKQISKKKELEEQEGERGKFIHMKTMSQNK